MTVAELHHPPGGRPHFVLIVRPRMTAAELEGALDCIRDEAPRCGIFARPLVWLITDADPPPDLAEVPRAFRLSVRSEWSTHARLERLRQLEEAAQ